MTEAEATTAATEEQKPKEGPDYDGVVKGKYDWGADTGNKKGADDDVKGEAITKYAWSDGKKAVSVYVEMEGLDDVAEDALKVESGESDFTFTITAIGSPPKQKVLRMAGLANE